MTPTAAKLLWAGRIARAKRTGRFSITAYKAANSFTSCAIQERTRMLGEPPIQKSMLGAPITAEASDLGFRFYYAVRDDNVAEAEKVYNEIQNLPRVHAA